MQASTRHTPSFGLARIVLDPGEAVRVRPGSMMASSYGLTIETSAPRRADGGIVASLAKAALGGDSMAVSTFTAPDDGAWIDLAPAFPGEVRVTELDGTAWCVARTAWLACAASAQLRTDWGEYRRSFGEENGVLLHVSGTGPLVTACCGAMDVLTLAEGEFATVAAAHVVAFADTVQSRLRRQPDGDVLVLDFAGPGEVYLQTRDPRVFAAGTPPASRP